MTSVLFLCFGRSPGRDLRLGQAVPQKVQIDLQYGGDLYSRTQARLVTASFQFLILPQRNACHFCDLLLGQPHFAALPLDVLCKTVYGITLL